MTRRELLVAGAVCGLPLWAKSHWDRSRLSAISDEIGKNSDDAVEFLHAAGLQLVEVRNRPGTTKEYWSGREADAQADAAHCFNEKVKVSCVNTSLLRFAWPETGQTSPEQERWDRRMEDLRKALRCARVMESDKVRIFAGLRSADPAAARQRVADTIGEMAVEAERQKISLALENDPATNIATCEEMAAVMKLVASKWVGINWCPWNSRQVEKQFPAGYALLPKKRILNVRAQALSLTPGGDAENWKGILVALDKDGYSGKVALETGATGSDRFVMARDSVDQLEHIIREVS